MRNGHNERNRYLTLRRARDKRRRLRRKLEIDVVPVEVDKAIVNLLIDLGWLACDKSDDRKHVGDAIARMLHETTSSPAGPSSVRKF
jgi:hypothetical protein